MRSSTLNQCLNFLLTCLVLGILYYYILILTKCGFLSVSRCSVDKSSIDVAGATSRHPFLVKPRIKKTSMMTRPTTTTKPNLYTTTTAKSIVNFDKKAPLTFSASEHTDLPIAFSIFIEDNAERAYRLFRLIYRPYNVYCIQIDREADSRIESDFKNLIAGLLRGTSEVHVIYIPSHERIKVAWKEHSALNATLACARKLFEYSKKVYWHYFINLDEKTFPLRTNWELVTALKYMLGSHSVEISNHPALHSDYPNVKTKKDFKWIKGSNAVALHIDFVRYILNDPNAQEVNDILASNKVAHPDELFFNTLAHSLVLGAPGVCTDPRPTHPQDNQTWHMARYRHWSFDGCGSRVSERRVCSFGVGDLPKLMSRPEFFADRFDHNIDPEAYDLLERWIELKYFYEQKKNSFVADFDEKYYAQLYCSMSHL